MNESEGSPGKLSVQKALPGRAEACNDGMLSAAARRVHVRRGGNLTVDDERWMSIASGRKSSQGRVT
jgi:hypothetical protein